jgi:hypothetical protein
VNALSEAHPTFLAILAIFRSCDYGRFVFDEDRHVFEIGFLGRAPRRADRCEHAARSDLSGARGRRFVVDMPTVKGSAVTETLPRQGKPKWDGRWEDENSVPSYI